MDITFVIYSHTDFLDMLSIQIEQVSAIKNKILVINENEICSAEVYSHFDRVLFYKDSDPYGTRLLSTISTIKSKYLLFSHEIDILLAYKWDTVGKLLDWMDSKSVDKIDLRVIDELKYDGSYEFTKIDDHLAPSEWTTTNLEGIDDHSTYLTFRTDKNTYRYNVNPTLWKTSAFCDLLTFAQNKTYREIEYDDTQEYMKNFSVANLHSRKILQCGYFRCVDIYKFFHITHYGLLVNPNQQSTTEFNQSFADCTVQYHKIIEDHNLKNRSRTFNR